MINKTMDTTKSIIEIFLGIVGMIIFFPFTIMLIVIFFWRFVRYRGWRNPLWNGLDWEQHLVFAPKDRPQWVNDLVGDRMLNTVKEEE